MKNQITKWDGQSLVSVSEEVELMKLLNDPPSQKAVKRNKYANNAAYLDVGLIEAQLDRFFGSLNWSFVVTKLEVQLNAIVCTGDLIIFYKDRQIRRSGVGSSEIQMRSGTKAMSPENISPKAMERDAPKAKSQALKNAAHSLGDAFGRSINRAYKHGYIEHSDMNTLRGGVEDVQDIQELDRMREFIQGATNMDQLNSVADGLPQELQGVFDNKKKELKK